MRTEIKWRVTLVAVVTLGGLWRFAPIGSAQKRLEAMPMKGFQFAGRDIALTEQDRAVFGAANVLRREYTGRGGDFLLTVVDGSRNRHAVHDPLYCLQGAGWQPIAQKHLPLSNGEGALVRLRKADGSENVVFYWYSARTERFSSPLRYWWHSTLRRLTFGKSGEEPALVIVQPYQLGTFSAREFLRCYPFVETL